VTCNFTLLVLGICFFFHTESDVGQMLSTSDFFSFFSPRRLHFRCTQFFGFWSKEVEQLFIGIHRISIGISTTSPLLILISRTSLSLSSLGIGTPSLIVKLILKFRILFKKKQKLTKMSNLKEETVNNVTYEFCIEMRIDAFMGSHLTYLIKKKPIRI